MQSFEDFEQHVSSGPAYVSCNGYGGQTAGGSGKPPSSTAKTLQGSRHDLALMCPVELS